MNTISGSSVSIILSQCISEIWLALYDHFAPVRLAIAVGIVDEILAHEQDRQNLEAHANQDSRDVIWSILFPEDVARNDTAKGTAHGHESGAHGTLGLANWEGG